MLDARRRAMLQTMGVDVWQLRTKGRVEGAEGQRSSVQGPVTRAKGQGFRAQAQESTTPSSDSSALGPGPSDLDWQELREAVARCEACALHQGRTQTVFGVGNQDADLMIIGEAPGGEEDRQGEPFVGRAGQLLNAMLAAIGFARERVYIANIVKCRPAGNRDPHADEAAACQGYLYRQIELIGPKLILSVGRVSAHNLLHTEDAVGRLRGRTHRFQPGDIPLIVTYHPAYLLRRPEEKAKAWQDLQAAYRVLHDDAD
jgi:DNA polymerase